jgi:IclR family transcriptional regulator, acetate operon repressor
MSRVQSIERAFAVLGALSGGPVGVTEVAERVDLPKSTVARLLGSLQREGAVEQIPGETRYRLGSRLLTLAAAVVPEMDVSALARPYLVRLAAMTGEAAGLSVPDGFSVQYVEQVDSLHEVQVRDWTGTSVPMHAVSSGQALLARLSPALLDAFLERPLERFTARTLVDPAALRARLDQVRADGYAWVHDEFAEGLSSVAAVVTDAGGTAVAAVHIHGPSYRFPGEGRQTAVAQAVVAAAERVSAGLRLAAG